MTEAPEASKWNRSTPAISRPLSGRPGEVKDYRGRSGRLGGLFVAVANGFAAPVVAVGLPVTKTMVFSVTAVTVFAGMAVSIFADTTVSVCMVAAVLVNSAVIPDRGAGTPGFVWRRPGRRGMRPRGLACGWDVSQSLGPGRLSIGPGGEATERADGGGAVVPQVCQPGRPSVDPLSCQRQSSCRHETGPGVSRQGGRRRRCWCWGT